MSIEHPDEPAALRGAGRVVAETLRELRRHARAGVQMAPDGRTIRTGVGSPTAHAEHTVVITAGAPLVLTA